MKHLLVASLAALAAAGPGGARASKPKRSDGVERWSVQADAVTDCQLPNARPPAAQRRFVSPVIDSYIASMVPKFKDPNMATLFANGLYSVTAFMFDRRCASIETQFMDALAL